MNCFLFRPKIAQAWSLILAFFLLIGFSLNDKVAGQEEVKLEILPYLQNPGPTQMTVCFLSTNAMDVKVEYGKNPKSMTKIKATGLKIPKTNWTIWKARIAKLQPGTTYHYKVVYKEGRENKTSEAYTFKTADYSAAETKCIAFTDIHDNTAAVDTMMKYVKPDDFEYSILLGDMWNDPSTAENAKQVFTSMEAYVRQLDASNKPMLHIRGNHDTRGGFSPYMSYLFDLPLNNPKDDFAKQNAYHDFRFGPVWFISPDSGEDGDKQAETFLPYRQRQIKWLKDTFAKSPSKNAPWRVLATHIPLYTADWGQPDSLKKWEPILNEGKIDIMMSGHDHSATLYPKGKTFKNLCYPGETVTPPYPVIIGGGPDGSVMLVTASQKNLTIRMLDAKGKEIHKVDLKK